MPWLDRKRHLKSKLENLREAGRFLGLSILSIILVLFVLGWVAYAFQASAASGINPQLNYQGKLNDSSGVAVSDGTYNIKLAIYEVSSGGTCLWTAVGSCADGNIATTTVTTVNGVFSVVLGDTGQNSLATSTIDWNTDSLYLGVTIRGTVASPVYDGEMTPRKRITSSAYAFNADQIDGIHATSTAAALNQLLALDSYGNLNLFGQGVSSTYATTTWLYVRGNTQIDGNATTTGSGYFGTLGMNNEYINNWSDIATLNGSDIFTLTNWFATTTWAGGNNLTVTGYTSSTNGLFTQGNLHIGGNASFDGLVSGAGFTLGQQNFWNSTSTWTAYDTNWARNANATTTYPGFASQFATYYNATTTQTNFLENWNAIFNATSTWAGFAANWNSLYNATTTKNKDFTFSDNLTVSGNATTSGNLNVSGYASTTNLVLADGASNLGSYYDLYVNSGNLFFDGTQLTGSSGLSFWQYGAGLEKAITPTSTASGIFVTASSTIAANFRVDGNATTTKSLYIGSQLNVATSSPWAGYELAVTGDGVFSSNLYAGGNLVAEGYASSTNIYTSGILHVGATSVFDGLVSGLGFDNSVNTLVDSRISSTWRGKVNGVASLGADGKILNSELSALAISDTFVVGSEAEMLALSSAGIGDVAIRTDVDKSYILSAADYTVLANWKELLSPSDGVISVNGERGAVVLTTDQISEGSGNLYFTNTRVDNRITSYWRGLANGLASLDASGKVPTSQIPDITINNTYVVANQVARLALSANVGDVAVQTDVSKTYILKDLPATSDSNWVELLNSSAVISVNGYTGAVTLTSSDISEGSNLYWTNARFDERLIATSTWSGELQITDNGNLGVGIDPSYPLEVVGIASTTDNVYVGKNLYVGQANSADSDIIYFDQGGQSLTWNNTNSRFELSTDWHISGSATTTKSIYVGQQLNVATTTPWTGYELAVTGDAVLTGNLFTLGYGQFNNVTTTDTLSVGGYASSTGGLFTQGNLHVGGTASFDGLVSGAGFTLGQQNFWNSTSTWTAFDTNWARNANATTTYPGFADQFATYYNATSTKNLDFTFSDDLTISGNATTSGNLNISGYASTTNLVLADGGSNLGTYYDLYVNSGNLFFDGTQLTGSSGLSFWQYGPGLEKTITPTSTASGIFVTASSTIAANFRVDGSATTTKSFYVGNQLNVATTTPWTGYELAVTGDEVLTGSFYNLGLTNLTDLRTLNLNASTTANFSNINAYGLTTLPDLRLANGLNASSTVNFLNENTYGLSTLADLRLANGLNASSTANFLNLKTYGLGNFTDLRSTNLNASTTANFNDLLVYDDATITDTLVVGTTAVTATTTVLYGGALIDTDTLVVNANENRVGIGTASPGVKLDVQGTRAAQLTLLNLSTNNRVSAANDEVSMDFHWYGTDQLAMGRISGYVQNNGTNDSGLKFYTAPLGAISATPAMTIDKSGNVGIGTTTPNATLNVVGSGFTGIVAGQRTDASTVSGLFGLDSSSGGIYLQNDTNNLRVYTGATIGSAVGTERLTILGASGNVGIGDITPAALFTVGDGDKFKIDTVGNATTTGSLYVDSPTLVVNADLNQVGIGTATFNAFGTSNQLLNLYSNVNNSAREVVYASSTGLIISNNATTNSFVPLIFGHPEGGDISYIRSIYMGNNEQKMTFGGGVNGGGDRMYLHMIGNIGQYNLGLATSTPWAKLSVTNTQATPSFIVEDQASDPTPFIIDTSGNVSMAGNATTTGNLAVGPGTGNSTIELHNASVMKWKIYNDTSTGPNNLYIVDEEGNNGVYMLQDAGDWTASSDIRLKENRVPITDALSKIMNINGYTYNFKNSTRREIGLVAQEVQPYFPELVDSSGEYWGITYARLGPVLLEAIKEQQGQIDSFKSQSASTTLMLLGQQTQLDELSAKIDNLTVATSTGDEVSEPLVVIDNSDLDIQTLAVRQAATFYGTLYVQGEAGFMHKVVFEQDIEVKGKIYASADQAGTATIPVGATSTEIMFASEYEVAPKITATAKVPVPLGISDQTTKGFRIYVIEPVTQDLTFDWIALAVKGASQPPVISELIVPEIVEADAPVELWAKVTDPDTQEADLTYAWNFSPNLGTLAGNTGLVYWTPQTGTGEETQVTVTVTVSDGTNNVSQSKIIRVLASLPAQAGQPIVQQPPVESPAAEPPAEEPPVPIAEPTPPPAEPVVISGCTDQTATNYNHDATQDDGSCQFAQAPETSEVQPTAQQPDAGEQISTADQPADGVGGEAL